MNSDKELENTTVSDVTENDTDSDNSNDTAEEKKLGKIIKEKIVTNGKDSAINFVIKKLFTCLLSALLSAALVLFTQYSFKDKFKDYVKDFVLVNISEFNSLVDHAAKLEDMDPEEAEEYCRKNNIYSRSKKLLETALAYSSDDDDIMILHNSYKEVCVDLHDLSILLYSSAVNETSENNESNKAYDDVLAISGDIQIASTSMSMSGSLLGEDAETENQDNKKSESYVAMMRIKSKLEIFVNLANDLCEKNNIEPFISR